MTTSDRKSASGDQLTTEGALLALETSTSTADVVLARRDGTLLARRTAVAARHSANLLALCAEVLAEAGLTVPGLAGIACGAGPGSFTGLRVGMAVAKGLAMPFDLPFLAVSSLEALALGLAAESAAGAASGSAGVPCIAACLDGGKGQIFGAYFAPDGQGELLQLGENLAVAPSAFPAAAPAEVAGRAIYAGGPGLSLLGAGDVGTPSGWTFGSRTSPTAAAVAALAWRRRARGERDELGGAVPVYGRAADITTPKARGPRP